MATVNYKKLYEEALARSERIKIMEEEFKALEKVLKGCNMNTKLPKQEYVPAIITVQKMVERLQNDK